MKTNRLYRILRIIYTTCLWKPDLFTQSFLIPWSSYWKEQWSSHHEQRKKDQPCSNCKWSFLEVSEQPFSECNLNVIVNVIGVFRGFPIFSQIDRNRWKIRLFGTYIVSNLSPGDAAAPPEIWTETWDSLDFRGCSLSWNRWFICIAGNRLRMRTVRHFFQNACKTGLKRDRVNYLKRDMDSPVSEAAVQNA